MKVTRTSDIVIDILPDINDSVTCDRATPKTSALIPRVSAAGFSRRGPLNVFKDLV